MVNLFAIGKLIGNNACPKDSAISLNDKHIVKQGIEANQIGAEALLRWNTPPHLLPLTKSGHNMKGGYPHHPCTIWGGNTRSNFVWTMTHAISIFEEYQVRFGKRHFSHDGAIELLQLADFIPPGDIEPHAVAISVDSNVRRFFDKIFINLNEFHQIMQYRLYYLFDKHTFNKYEKGRPKPEWLIDLQIDFPMALSGVV